MAETKCSVSGCSETAHHTINCPCCAEDENLCCEHFDELFFKMSERPLCSECKDGEDDDNEKFSPKKRKGANRSTAK